MNFNPDSVTEFPDLSFRQLPYPLRVHDEVLTEIQKHPPERGRRLRLVLMHLASLGRTSVVKGCSDTVNRGWRRAPLGGHGGMQYYLWWSPQGGPHVRGLDFPSKAIVVRAIRHHDDHAALTAAREADYHAIETSDVVDPTEGALGATPFTDDQTKFVRDSAPVRLLLGRPGAGKTTALLNAIESRGGQRVLYVTWSDRLCAVVREHASAFAPEDTSVEAVDFRTLLGRIVGRDLDRETPGQSRAGFMQLLDRVAATEFGPWASCKASLFAETRAYLFGRAGDNADTGDPAKLPRLSADEYVRMREERVGVQAAMRLPDVVALAERNGNLATVFPELTAAHEALRRLRSGFLPEGYARFDKIAVDEAQDLTSVEMAVVIELCRAIATANGGRAPGLLVAGDEGQTVRPSGFEVAEIKRRLNTLQTPTEHTLQIPLRYPTEIAEVIDRAQGLYRDLERAQRPTNQVQAGSGEHVNGQVRHVSEPDPDLARKLLLELVNKRSDSILVVAAGDSVPEWVGDELSGEVWLPNEAKGLEFQTVIVLDPGRVVASVRACDADKLRAAERRTAIDRLRVAMTRATETLVFFDVGATAEEGQRIRELLNQTASIDGETFFSSFGSDTDEEVDLEDRVQRLINQSRTLREERPEAAWRRAYHAMELLGDPNRPQGVSAADIRVAAYREAVDTAIRFVAGRLNFDRSMRDAAEHAAARLAKESGSPPDVSANLMRVLEALGRLKTEPSRRALEIFQCVSELGAEAEWVTHALTAVSESLRVALDAAADDKQYAGALSSRRMVTWLPITGHVGDPVPRLRALRRKALTTLLDASDVGRAVAVHEVHDGTTPEDYLLTGRLRDMQERYREAAEAYEKAGNKPAAVAAWRKLADWEKANRLSDAIPEQEAAQLTWLLEAERFAAKRPEGLLGSLSDAETERMAKLFPFATPSGVSRRGNAQRR